MDLEVRPLPDGRIDELYRAVEVAFGVQNRPEAEAEKELLETDRALVVLDGDRIVGGIGAFTFVMTVPGGALPTAGVTCAGVMPTHRRRGALRALTERQLHDFHDRREPLAALFASESSIYGRYGYGPAVHQTNWTVERAHADLSGPRPAAGTVRLVDRDLAWALLAEVYEKVRPQQPGFVTRTPGLWRHQFFQPDENADPGQAYFFAVLEGADGPEGYAAYRYTELNDFHENLSWLPCGQVWVRELVSTTREGYATLWDYIFGIDLVTSVAAISRPAEEPLARMLRDGRRLRQRLMDAVWLRLVDVPAALVGRTYGTEDRIVVAVRDGLCPWNDGTWELVASPDAPSCTRTNDAPDLTLSVAELSAIYLGGTTLRSLHVAGRVDEHTPGAVHRADLAFASPVAPWAPLLF